MKEKKQEAKKKMLSSLSKEMRGMMSDSYGKDLKKVTVSSDSEEGLKEGLSKAQEIMKAKGYKDKEEGYDDESMESEHGEDYEEDMPMESYSDDEMDYDDYSKEDLIKMLAKYKK